MTELLELRGLRQYNRALAIYRQDHDNFHFQDMPRSRNRWLQYELDNEVIGQWIRTGRLLGKREFTLVVKFFVCADHPMGQCSGHAIPFTSGYKHAKTRLTKETQDPNVRSVSLLWGGYKIERMYRSESDADWIRLW